MKLNIRLLHDPESLLLGTHPRQMRTYGRTKTCTRAFMALVCITGQTGNDPNINRQVNGETRCEKDTFQQQRRANNGEQTERTGDNTGGSRKHSAEQKKPDTKHYLLQNSMHVKFRKSKAHLQTYSDGKKMNSFLVLGAGSGQRLKLNAYEGTVWHESYRFCFLIVMVMSQHSSNYTKDTCI